MNIKDIYLLKKLTVQAEKEAEAVAKKLIGLDGDYSYVDEYSFNDKEVVQCTGINDWGDGTKEHICLSFPYELLGASDEVIDAYIAEEKRKEAEIKEANERFRKEEETRKRREQYEELKKEFENT
jgi:hypothetical protein